MSPPQNQGLRCPACGSIVRGTERACPRCGNELRVALKFECPYCGDLVPQGSTKCPSCHLDLSEHLKDFDSGLKKSPEPESRGPRVSERPSTVGDGRRLACPGCRHRLNGDETACPDCGRAISNPGELLCPICLTPVGSNLDKCSTCGAILGKGDLAPKPVQKAEDALDTLLQEFDSMVPCPKCGVLAPSGTKVCAKCGSFFSVEDELEKDLHEMDAIEEPPPQSESYVFDDALDKLGEIEKTATVRTRSRKLRPEKVTKVAPQIRPMPRGLSNGVGQTNGKGLVNGSSRITSVGRTNGTGATNGKSLVNGTGISNGLKGRGKAAGGGRATFLLKWQFLVVLVSIVVVISSLAAMSYLNKGSAYAADGDFGEWSEAPMFGASVQSDSPGIDIVEWSVAVRTNNLFFYVLSEGDIMGSAAAQRYCLFVDVDGDSSTGCLVESLGAEYMLQVDGWNNTIQSTEMFSREANADQLNWSGWSSVGSLNAIAKDSEIEGHATIYGGLGDQSRFILLSKDALSDGALGHVATSSGGLLVIEQTPSSSISDDGIVSAGASVTVLDVTFSCEGSGGDVDSVTPAIDGAPLAASIGSFSLEEGEEHVVTIALDTSGVADGQLVTAEIIEAGIESSFTNIQVIGERASAYVGAAPPSIVIDGAFADWDGLVAPDVDASPIANRDINISEIGNVNITGSSYFYVSVEGEMCSGTFIPAFVMKPSGSGGGGGGTVIKPRITAEDVLTIYVDSDRSSSTGSVHTASSKTIGADHIIEVRGLHGRITSTTESDWTSGSWRHSSAVVDAAKDAKRIEIEVSASSFDNRSDIEFIVETTTWSGASDSAAMTSSGTRAMTSSYAGGIGIDNWAVDGAASGAYGTAMSYQRKVFYDGTNYWSFYFDGVNTVHKYSTDDGVTWTRMGTMFKTSGVNETSIWYDSANNVVFAVGDTSTASKNVTLQKGTVTPAAHNISWAASDSVLAVSTIDLTGKNSFICRDNNGYLWVLASNNSQSQPVRYDLTAFKSQSTDSITSWAYSGSMLAAPSSSDTVKGSIVPAGTGSDVWAVYTYSGSVASKKFTGTWQTPQTVIFTGGGGGANTENSPPSIVVDGKGVVHVVYGNSRKTGQNSIPSIEYAHNNTGATTFSLILDLDQFIPSGVGDYYPTISLDSSTNDLFVFWLRSDTSFVPQTVMCKKYSSGSWSNLTLSTQNAYAKQYLTSVYSVSGELKICWQWTQNTTSSYEVRFDLTIPEFHEIVLPVLFVMAVFVILPISRRRKTDPTA